MQKTDEVHTAPLVSPLYWRAAAAQIKKPAAVAASGVLAAVGMVIKSFTISIGQLLRVGFWFLAPALSGYLYGPLVAGFAGMVVDILGYLLNPTGPYFFGFTFNAFLSGFIYGCWLWRRPVKLSLVFGACLSSIVAVSFLLNPLWLHMLYGEAYLALVWMRVPTNLVVLPVNTAMLFGLLRITERQKRHLVKE